MPRIFGHDLLAVIAAALAVYATGFVIYGLLFAEAWMSMQGLTEADFAGQEWKMALSPVMPVLTVVFLAGLISMSGASGLAGHVRAAVYAWAGFALPALLYAYVYGVSYPVGLLAIDAAHLLIGAVVAAAVLTWRKGARRADPQPAL